MKIATWVSSLPSDFWRVLPEQDIELLVGSPNLDIRVQDDRVIPLHQRVEELVDKNGRVLFVSLSKIITFEHTGDRVTGRKLDHILEIHLVKPLAVKADGRLLFIEYFKDLSLVGLGVLHDVFCRQLFPGRGLAGRVADHAGEITYDYDDVVTEVLERLHFPQNDGMTEMNVRRGGIEAELDIQRLALLRGFFKFGF
jgi:hypothetical protein